MRNSLVILATLAACQDYRVREQPPPDPADPPEDPGDLFGDQPDWADCFRGYSASYYNLTNDHPDVEPQLGEGEPLPTIDPNTADWWDRERQAYTDYEPSLDFGGNWWPVDGGLEDDPRYFAGRFVAWMRVYDGGGKDVVIGASTDLWVFLRDDLWLEVSGSEEFVSETYRMDLSSGVYPIDVRYGHRAGDFNGLRLRFASEDVQICYPDYSGDDEG